MITSIKKIYSGAVKYLVNVGFMAKDKENKEDIEIITFGCRLNIHESEVMRKHAQDAGLKDTVIINTCAVTNEAERQARQAIRRIKRKNPSKKIIVTGCSAQIAPDSYSKMSEVSKVIGNDLKLKSNSWKIENTEKIIVNDIMSVKETAIHLISGFETQTRAFLQVQNGCNHRCTFCIIPYGRGNSRSVAIGEIVKQIKTLVKSGYKEVVMTGVDITSYGEDLPARPKLGQMIRRVLKLVPELARLRLSSLDPIEIDDDLWELIANEPRLMPHLHLSVQAGDNMILKRMKRRHLREDVIEVTKKAKKIRPDIVFGADIIAGFPTETDEMFQNSLELIKDAELTYLHVFPYSARPMTPAAKMPQIDGNIIKQRAKILRDAGEKQLQKLIKNNMGQKYQLLLEKNNQGHTENFIPVVLNGKQDIITAGNLIDIKIIDFDEAQSIAIGEIV